MVRQPLLLALPVFLLLAACTDAGNLKIPFTHSAPFVASAVPADFAIQVDENHDTFYSRQHIQQNISVADAMSTTKYTTFRDYNNSVSNQFSQETPLSPTQLQNMWNDVARYNLLDRSTIWVNWLSGADLYKRDTNYIQIRANGQTRIYRQTNGFAGPVRPLVLQVQAVRLPISQDSTTRVVPERREAPAMAPAGKVPELPATEPAKHEAPLPLTPETQPETKPAATKAYYGGHEGPVVPAPDVVPGTRQ